MRFCRYCKNAVKSDSPHLHYCSAVCYKTMDRQKRKEWYKNLPAKKKQKMRRYRRKYAAEHFVSKEQPHYCVDCGDLLDSYTAQYCAFHRIERTRAGARESYKRRAKKLMAYQTRYRILNREKVNAWYKKYFHDKRIGVPSDSTTDYLLFMRGKK